MALKRRAPAQVTEHFLSLMQSIYEQWMANEEQVAERYPGGPEAYKQFNHLRHARIENLLHGGDGDGRSGKSYEITKLRALPYSLFTAIEHNGNKYLMGETRPIIIEHNRETYHLGAYRVCVGTDAILRNNLNKIHMIPMKAPRARLRFMHHNASGSEDTHPLDRSVNTCWGNFGSTIKPFAEDADIPELFRGLQIYLSRYNSASPLAGAYIDRLGWDTETPWETWNANRIQS